MTTIFFSMVFGKCQIVYALNRVATLRVFGESLRKLSRWGDFWGKKLSHWETEFEHFTKTMTKFLQKCLRCRRQEKMLIFLISFFDEI